MRSPARQAGRAFQAVFGLAPLALKITLLAGAATLLGNALPSPADAPIIGDIAWFRTRPAHREARAAFPVIHAARLEGIGLDARETPYRCRLDTALMQQTGGSLIVFGADPTRDVLAVHWTGGMTHATEDCGTDTDLRVSRSDFLRARFIAETGMATFPEAIAF